MRLLRTLPALSLGLALLAPGVARAGDSAAAEVLFNEGKKLMAEGRYPEACAKLEESQRLDAGIGTLFNLADCHEHIGKIASAWGEFTEVASLSKAAGQAAREEAARQRAVVLEPRLSKLVIRVTSPVPGLQVKRDDTVVGAAQYGTPIPVDPGDHKITASAPKRREWSTSVRAVAGTAPVVLDIPELQNAPEAPPTTMPGETFVPATTGSDGKTQRTIGLVMAGVGGLGIIAGAVAGAFSMSYKNEANGQNTGNNCSTTTNECQGSTGVDNRHAAIVAGDVSTVGFVAGGILALGGMVLFFSAPKRHDAQTASVGVGIWGTRAGIGGEF